MPKQNCGTALSLLSVLTISMISFSSRPGSFPKASAKVHTFSETARLKTNFFQTFLHPKQQLSEKQIYTLYKKMKRKKSKREGLIHIIIYFKHLFRRKTV